MNWTTLFYLLGAGLMVWLAVRMFRNNPEAFSKHNLGKSATTLGFLTLMIIGVVIFCVWMLKT